MSVRVFTMTITVDDEAEGFVEVQEKGDKANRGKAKVPAGKFGISEGLIQGGQLVRTYYRTKQRRLVLEAREAAVEQRRAERIAAKPKPAPKAPDPAQTTIANTEDLERAGLVVRHAGIGDPECADCKLRLDALHHTGFGNGYCDAHAPVRADEPPVCETCRGTKGHFEEKTDTTPERFIPCPACQEDFTPQIVEEDPIDWANNITSSGESDSPVDAAIERVVTINDHLKKAVAK